MWPWLLRLLAMGGEAAVGAGEAAAAGGAAKFGAKAFAKAAAKKAGGGLKGFGSYVKNNKLNTEFGALNAYGIADGFGIHPLDALMGTSEREMEMESEGMPDSLRGLFDQTEAQVGEDFLSRKN